MRPAVVNISAVTTVTIPALAILSDSFSGRIRVDLLRNSSGDFLVMCRTGNCGRGVLAQDS
ncbi:MAG: hypothetical protein QY310_13505 [Candidatus Jettenia sp. CY-1]|nr:MAG: hypothetical protein QY310_13505 [Candidatus Jettenia sp. CY-1]